MNKVTRTLLMTGMGIAASVAIGAGSASAASAAPASPSTPQAASQAAKIKLKTRVINYYDNVFVCNKIGRIGERRDRWDDYNCVRIRWGFHRGDYALVARWYDNGGWGDHGDHNGHGGDHGGWGDHGDHDGHGGDHGGWGDHGDHDGHHGGHGNKR